MSDWTPGPWSAEDMENDTYFPSVRLSKNGRLTINEGGHPQDRDMIGTTMGTVRANALLIAAAPDLYDNLNWCVQRMKDDGYHGEEIAWCEDALAKANGKTGDAQ